jgi:uncharacterized protein YdcH (DUF465 family)
MHPNQSADQSAIHLKNKMKAFTSLVALAALGNAFQMPQSKKWHRPTSLKSELSPTDEMCIENVAEFCLHESCDVEEYEALINQLEDQKAHFIRHVANVESLLIRLKDSNHPEHDPDEVTSLIENIKSTLAGAPSVTP